MSTTAHVMESCTELLIPAIIIHSGPRRTCFDSRHFAARSFAPSEFAAHVLSASPQVGFEHRTALALLTQDGTVYSDSGLLPPPYAGHVVPLSKFTHLILRSHRLYLQELMVGLAAPSLQLLDVELHGPSTYGSFPVPHLCKFICDTEYLPRFSWNFQIRSSSFTRARVPSPLNL